MTAEDRLAEIRARANAATPCPWWAWDRTHDIGFEIAVGEPEPDGFPAEKLPEGFKYDIGRHEDAEFIAHARQDVPFLLDLVDELDKLTALDLHPEADITKHHDPVSAGYITGATAALKMVRERIAKARNAPPPHPGTPPTPDGHRPPTQ